MDKRNRNKLMIQRTILWCFIGDWLGTFVKMGAEIKSTQLQLQNSHGDISLS